MEVLLPDIYPEVVIAPSARPSLAGDVRIVLDSLLALLKREAGKRLIPVTKVEVVRFADPEEDVDELVIIQHVNIPPKEALDYWDELGTAVETWIDTLPEALKTIATERFSVEIFWNSDDSTA